MTKEQLTYAMEQSILSTYMHMGLEEKIDYKIFTSNLTIKSIAKAIRVLQDKDLPCDELSVVNFIESKMPLDYNELVSILSKVAIPETAVSHYMNTLAQNIKEKSVGANYGRI